MITIRVSAKVGDTVQCLKSSDLSGDVDQVLLGFTAGTLITQCVQSIRKSGYDARQATFTVQVMS